MSVIKRAGRVILPAAVLFGALTACGSTQDTDLDQSLLVTTHVTSLACSDTSSEKLRQAADFVSGANARQTNDILKRNEGANSLEPLQTALNNKISECGGTPDHPTPGQDLAKQICNNDNDPNNEGTVADCKKRGAAAFEYLKGRNLQGNENVRSTPAGFHKELEGLADTPESLSKAVDLTGVLATAEQLAKTGGEVSGAQILAKFPNAKQEDLNAGTDGDHPVDWALNAHEERGGASFGTKTMKTKADIAEFLNGPSAESQAARDHVKQAINAEGYGDDEVARAMSGEGYVPIQIKEASQILGTTYFLNGKVQVLNKWRQAAGGDVYWLFFTKDGKLIGGALLRADCDNPDAQAIMVLRPGMPQAPPVEQPPGEETCPQQGTTPNPDTNLCHPPEEGCKEANNCTTTPPCKEGCTTTTPNNPKDPNQAPGQGGKGDGGKSQHGGDGTERHTADPNPSGPAAGQPGSHPVTTAKPAPPVHVTQNPNPPTVQPSTQSNTGVVPTAPGCGNPEFC